MTKHQKKATRQIELGFSYSGGPAGPGPSTLQSLNPHQQPHKIKGKHVKGVNIDNWMKETGEAS
jgi:hypothetical protein